MFVNKKEIKKLEAIVRELENRHNKLLDFLNIKGKYIDHEAQPYHFFTGGVGKEIIRYEKRTHCPKCKKKLC
jgi:hypothetical protein